MEPVFVTDEPALLLESRGERILVVADLHIGIEYDYHIRGIRIPSQTKKIVKRIDDLIDKTKASRLVILGDVKHKVPGISRQELREIPEFFRHFASRVRVDVLPVNHDGGLKAYLPKSVKFHKSSGFRLGDLFFTHGHAWPSEDFLKASFVVTAHNHPQIEFRDSLGYRWSEPVWIRAELRKSAITKKYKKATHLPELVVIPCFNEFAGGVALNRKNENPEQRKPFLGPLIKNIRESNARVYMLDGVFLGELGKL